VHDEKARQLLSTDRSRETGEEPKEKIMDTQTTFRNPKPEQGSRYMRFLALALVLSLITIQAASGDSDSHEGKTLTGNWVATVTRTNPPPGVPPTFLSMQTYFGDGSFIEESNTPVMYLIRGLAHGDWEKTGHRQFSRSFIFFRFDTSRNFIGTQTATGTITLSEDGQTFEGVGEIKIFDVDGNLIATAQGTEVGSRVTF
jgi:hypothetical protein